MSSFSPTVLLPDGRTIKPQGWMWVMGFALAGCQWAIDEANTPEFRRRARQAIAEQRRKETEAEISALEARITRLRSSLNGPEAQ